MARSIDAPTLKAWLEDGDEIALLDVREHGQYGEAHLFYAVPLPYSRLEIELERLVPRNGTRVVLYDDGLSNVASRAARRAERIGYANIHILEGGAPAWRARGYRLFAGVHVPSKAFGELVEEACHTPRVTAAELKAMIDRGEKLVIVDGRPLSEYRKMNIPGGLCCPNGELALRIGRIAPEPKTKVIVNCAGRTRSIIGAQTLLHFGIPNPVYALENGTQGWFLAGFDLERGAARSYPAAPAGATLERVRKRARELAQRCEVPQVSVAQASRWLADANRTTYLLDVRTPEEFASGSLPGAQHAPGGQLVQGTDLWIGVRNARLVLADDDGVRAIQTAMWLRQMGHDAHVLREGVSTRLDYYPRPAQAALPRLAEAEPAALDEMRVIDLRPSMTYRKGHLPGAVWSIRPRLEQAVAGTQRPVALIADEAALAQAAALDLAELGVKEVRFLASGRMSGLALEATPGMPADAECIDFLFFTHDRHDGNRAAAIQYLTWETDLLRQLDASERARYRVIHEPVGQY